MRRFDLYRSGVFSFLKCFYKWNGCYPDDYSSYYADEVFIKKGFESGCKEVEIAGQMIERLRV